MSPVVKPEFGPTLPEIVAPRLRRWPRWARIALALAGIAVLVLFFWARFIRGDGREPLVVRGPVPFNLLVDSKLRQVAPVSGESLRLETLASNPDLQRMVVRPVVLPAYQGDINGLLPAYATELIDDMRSADKNFILRAEGRARVNSQPGYQIQYQTLTGGRTTYGRRTLLFLDEPGTREGVDATMTAVRSLAVPHVDSIGSNGPIKLPYRSLRIGTERP